MTYVLSLPHAYTQLHHVEFVLENTKFVTPHLHLHVSKIPNEDCHVSWIIDEISNCEYLQKVHTLVILIFTLSNQSKKKGNYQKSIQ